MHGYNCKASWETSQQQCRCQLTPPCSIARLNSGGFVLSLRLGSCSYSCGTLVLRFVMVEWEVEGRCIVFVGQGPYVFAIFVVGGVLLCALEGGGPVCRVWGPGVLRVCRFCRSWGFVVYIGWRIRGCCGFRDPDSADKSPLSVAGDISVNTHRMLHPSLFSCHPTPMVDPSTLLTDHAHIPHWRGEATCWLLAMMCWRPLSVRGGRYKVIRYIQLKKTSEKHFYLPIFAFSRPWSMMVGGM